MSQDQESEPQAYLPLTPAEFNILLALADQARHGYGIMQEVAASSGGTLKLGPGTLYGSIKRMLGGGLIEESEPHPGPETGDERRRYYRLTSLGARVLQAEARRLSDLVRVARSKHLLDEPSSRGVGR